MQVWGEGEEPDIVSTLWQLCAAFTHPLRGPDGLGRLRRGLLSVLLAGVAVAPCPSQEGQERQESQEPGGPGHATGSRGQGGQAP